MEDQKGKTDFGLLFVWNLSWIHAVYASKSYGKVDYSSRLVLYSRITSGGQNIKTIVLRIEIYLIC